MSQKFDALAEVLSGIGARRLLAADIPPCGRMLEPYAAVHGLDLEVDTRLTARRLRGNERRLAGELRERAARKGGWWVVHQRGRDVLGFELHEPAA